MDETDRKLLEKVRATIEEMQAMERLILRRSKGTADPLDPMNKDRDGRLTVRGVKVLEAMFEQGANRNQAAAAMDITYRAAHLRWVKWMERKEQTRDDA